MSDLQRPEAAGYCQYQRQSPVAAKYGGGGGGWQRAELVLDQVISCMKKPVHLLSITGLSQSRPDGHPSIYGNSRHRGLDCTHWCLPGVPDTWNQLLFANLIQV